MQSLWFEHTRNGNTHKCLENYTHVGYSSMSIYATGCSRVLESNSYNQIYIIIVLYSCV